MLRKHKLSVFVDQREELENSKRRQSFETLLSHQIPHVTDSETSLRLKTIKFISAHLNYGSRLILVQNLKPILEHQLWQESNPQLAQHILKLLADVAVHELISEDKNTILSIVEILHKYLEAHQFFDDFVTTQIVSSLICIAEETGSFKELDRVLALKLLCTNKTSLRVKLSVLLAVTSESENDENGIVFEIFEGLTKDPFPSVRKTALDGLASIHKKGYKLTKGCYKRATALLQDKDELVRLSAIKLVMVSYKIEEIHTTNQINQAFLQLCALSRDMNMRVRCEALEALGEMGPLSENVLLQALSKKILGKATKKSTNAIQDVRDHLDCGGDFNLLTLSAAGAFLHGVEDEFFEVRVATIHSLARLSGFSNQFADGALDLLMDMLNDDSLVVRMHTLRGLLYMAQLDHLRVQEKHMHMFLGVLEDVNADIRSGARRLLGHMKLPSISMFKMSFDALMENLDKHPQDEKDILSVIYHIGKIHSTFVVCYGSEFVQKLTSYSNGESGLDHPHFPALLTLMLAAQISNVGICFQIPQKWISYANYYHYKLPLTLFGSTANTKVKNSQLDDKQRSSGNSNYEDMVASLSEILNDEEGNDMGLASDQTNFGSERNEAKENINTSDMEDGSVNKLLSCELPANVSDMSEKEKERVYSSYQSEILYSAANILKTVSGTWSLIKQKGLVGALKNLSECREAMRKIEGNFAQPISVISFASLYIRSIYFLLKLWINLRPTGYQQILPSGIEASQCILKKIENTVKRMKNCFLGLSEEQELHILELNALIHILRLSLLGINVPRIFKRLTSLICSAELLYGGDGLNHSSFLWKIKKSLSDENTKLLFFLKFVQELPEHFSIPSIPLGDELKEIRAALLVPNSCDEQPFRFVPGLPIGITVHTTLHNVTSECSIWLVMVLGKSIQYALIDVNQFQGLDGLKQGTITLPFYSTIKVASCYLEISVMMECPFDNERVSSCQAGPKRDLVLLSNVEKINLVASI